MTTSAAMRRIRGAPSLPDLFRAVSAVQPDAIAIVDGPVSLTYAQLDAMSERIANDVTASGAGVGEIIGIPAERSWFSVAGLLGILKAGAAYLPLDPTLPAARMRMMVDDSGARPLAGSPGTGDRCGPPPVAGDRPRVGRTDPAYVIYTSGSTGKPKGCVVTHGNVLALLGAALPLFHVGPADRWALFHSIAFDFSVWEIWGALATGATLVVVGQRAAVSAEELVPTLVGTRVTVLNQVPTSFREVYRAYREAGRPRLGLRYLVFGGESVDLPTIGRFRRDAAGRSEPTIVNMYGITETTVHATFKRLDDTDLAGPVRSPIGRALAHLHIELRDELGRPVAAGQPGEMWLSGAGLTAGYLNRPELTAERFVESHGRRYYRSGDWARFLDNGELEYLGRTDQQVQLRGFRVELEEIESVLRGCDGVRDAVVTVGTTAGGTELLVAYVVPDEAANAGLVQRVRRQASGHLPRHMLPSRITVVRALPRNGSGKLDRRAVRAWANDGRDTNAWRERSCR